MNGYSLRLVPDEALFDEIISLAKFTDDPKDSPAEKEYKRDGIILQMQPYVEELHFRIRTNTIVVRRTRQQAK